MIVCMRCGDASRVVPGFCASSLHHRCIIAAAARVRDNCDKCHAVRFSSDEIASECTRNGLDIFEYVKGSVNQSLEGYSCAFTRLPGEAASRDSPGPVADLNCLKQS